MPPLKKLDFEIYIVGVRVHADKFYAYQFIFNDGSVTQADASDLDPDKWTDLKIPEGSMIKRYELM